MKMAAVLAAALGRIAARSFSGLASEAVGPERGASGALRCSEPRSTRITGGPATGRSPTRPYSSTQQEPSSSRPSPCPKKIGEKYGVEYSEEEILRRYRWAYEQPWGQSRLRYENDGRPFWQFIVSSSTGCSDPQYFEELYHYYTTDKAWHLCDPVAEKVFKALRRAGVKFGIVSNFDALRCDHWFDAVIISAEVAAEKPNPTIFAKACELLGVKPEDAVHVGDDRRNDV